MSKTICPHYPNVIDELDRVCVQCGELVIPTKVLLNLTPHDYVMYIGYDTHPKEITEAFIKELDNTRSQAVVFLTGEPEDVLDYNCISRSTYRVHVMYIGNLEKSKEEMSKHILDSMLDGNSYITKPIEELLYDQLNQALTSH